MRHSPCLWVRTFAAPSSPSLTFFAVLCVPTLLDCITLTAMCPDSLDNTRSSQFPVLLQWGEQSKNGSLFGHKLNSSRKGEERFLHCSPHSIIFPPHSVPYTSLLPDQDFACTCSPRMVSKALFLSSSQVPVPNALPPSHLSSSILFPPRFVRDRFSYLDRILITSVPV